MSLQSEQFTENGLRKVTLALGTGLATLGVSAALTYGYLELQNYREVRAQWSEAKVVAEASDYEACLSQTQLIQPVSPYFSKAQALMQQCRLGQARSQAEAGQFVPAIESALLIPSSQESAHQESLPLIQDWSEAVINEGEALFQSGELEQAIATVRELPAASRADTESIIETWTNDWEKSETSIETAESLLQRGQWLAAKQSLQDVADVDFWTEKAEPLLTEAEAGIARVAAYEAEQERARAAALAAAASQQPVYTPPALAPAPAAPVPAAPAPAAPAPAPAPVAAPAPVYSEPAPVAAAPPPPPAPSFDQSVESLYESYRSQGQGTWDAWTQACRDAGGQMLDQGPEASCLP